MEGLLHALTDKKHSVKYWIKEQTNSCGNGELRLNVGCQNVGSQIQGDENEVALAAQQTFPAIGNDNGEVSN